MANYLEHLGTWKFVRTLGELQILTRASYVSLIVIPLVAGIWPAVRVAVNRYNDVVTDSIEAFDNAATKLENAAAELDESQPTRPVGTIISDLAQRISAVKQQYAPKTLKEPHLPKVWGCAFCAAVLVIAGNLLYQAVAPSAIKQNSIREYAEGIADRYAASPTHLAFSRAKGALRESNPKLIYEEYQVQINEKKAEIDRLSRKRETPLHDRTETISNQIAEEQESLERLKIEVVQIAAESEYDSLSASTPLRAHLASALYITGIFAIFVVIGCQAITVYNATFP